MALKGRKEGYEIVMDAAADLNTCLLEFEQLLRHLQSEEPTRKEPLQFVLATGDRLLTADEQDRVTKIVAQFSQFELRGIRSDVMTIAAAKAEKERDNLHVENRVIRSGQEIDREGDVLFIGSLHAGGTLRTTGNLFILGDVNGIIQAGFPDHADAVVIGDLSHATQLRIGDAIEIIDPDEQKYTNTTLSYINELHLLDHSDVASLKTLKTKLNYEMEEDR
ncbi:minC protein [Lactobacillus selangorensis]|uniref:MinC protein n=1 Tax=Lactobacillus selangorensis TaxID=81857 RepID=A0A0R2FSJ9_9LACO|nr:minC protein [Lactobacillus selangorensis]KRN34122.1 minC protein [Lactobacillus selangorensis]